jgi:hypothetical protein
VKTLVRETALYSQTRLIAGCLEIIRLQGNINRCSDMPATSFLSKSALNDTINATAMRRKRLTEKLKQKRNLLCLMDLSRAMNEIIEYQKMNEELRQVKIYEAELVYLRNML